MSGEALKRELQHDLRRASRRASRAHARLVRAFSKSSVDRQIGKFRTYRIKRMMQPLPSCDDAIRQKTCLMTA